MTIFTGSKLKGHCIRREFFYLTYGTITAPTLSWILDAAGALG